MKAERRPAGAARLPLLSSWQGRGGERVQQAEEKRPRLREQQGKEKLPGLQGQQGKEKLPGLQGQQGKEKLPGLQGKGKRPGN